MCGVRTRFFRVASGRHEHVCGCSAGDRRLFRSVWHKRALSLGGDALGLTAVDGGLDRRREPEGGNL
jgi:hypothetical protein